MPRPTLILLPGLLNTGRVYAAQATDLADIADVLTPELAAYETMADMAESVLAAAPERFALGGFSMGGYVAFEILRRAPQRIERLALIDTQAAPDTPEATARRLGLLEQCKIGRFHGVQPSLLPNLVHPSRLHDAAVVQPILDMALEIGPDGFVREQRAIMGRADSRPMLGSLHLPTVVICGRQDVSLPLARSEEMATTIPDARLAVLEICGHMAPLERPAEVSAALRRWLTQ